MITIDYSEREKLEKLVNDLDLRDLMDTQAIPYMPGNIYIVSAPAPITTITAAELRVNGTVFTTYVLSPIVDGARTITFTIDGQVNGYDTFVLGINDVQLYIQEGISDPLALASSRYVQCKNIMALLLWIASATDQGITDLSAAFTYPSLQTMPVDVAAAKFKSLLPKYYYLGNTEYKRLLTSLFTGAVFGGTLKGLKVLMEGFTPSTLELATLVRNPSLLILDDPILWHAVPLPYKEINFDFPVVVSQTIGPVTTTYVEGTDYVIKANENGEALVSWIPSGSKPAGSSTYTVSYYHAHYVINPAAENTYWMLQDHTMYASCDLGGASLGYSYCCLGTPGSTGYDVWQEQNCLHYFTYPATLSFTLDDRERWAQLLSSKMKSMGFIIDWYGYLIYQHLTYKYIVSVDPVTFETGLSLIAKGYVVGPTSYPIVYYYNGVTPVYLTTSDYSISRSGTLTINAGVIPANKTVHIELYFVPIDLIKYCQNIVKQQHVKIVNIYYDEDRALLNFWGV
jgi:hypothetical protein